ncbi:MAG TPA: hypothetical protein DIT64_20735 [Verrucomicrobiales bacterium]|nr:hypothetical protein [Verrucomicrobiales bacterium]
MKRIILFFLTAAASLIAADDYKGDVKDVRVVRHMDQHPGASLVWEPYIAQWKPKHLVVAYGAGIPGKTDMGSIYASVSTNDGDTWSEAVPVFDHNHWQGAIHFAYANAILFKPSDQEVMWCYAMRCPMNYRHSEDSQLVAAYSADGGRSWTPVELAMHYSGPLIVVAGPIETKVKGKTRYLFPAHRNTLRNDPLGSRDQFVLSSTSLLEWKFEGYIPQPETGDKVFLHEGGIAEGDSPDELKIVMRTANWEEKGALDPPRAFSSISKDGGTTWTAAKQEPELWNARSKGYFSRNADGSHLYVYNDGPAMPAKAGRTSLRYKVQPMGGAWSAEKTFYDAGIKNSYPTLVEVAPGDFRAVWDSGTPDKARTHIHFGKIKIKN